MTEQELIGLLIENISFQLRHSNYKRSLDIRQFAHSMTTGENQDLEITRYRRFEDDELKKQRIRLYNPRTKSALARPRKYWKRISRVEGIRRNHVSNNQQALAELEAMFWSFQPGKTLEMWLNEKLEYLGVSDPNAWIVYERHDTRDAQGLITKTQVWPFVVPSVDALNFSISYGVLRWFLCRTSEIEYVVKDGIGRSNALENYYLYAPGVIVRAREVGEKTIPEDGEQRIDVDVYAISSENNPISPAGSKKTRSFYLKTIQNGTSEVPALYAGCYIDEKTGSENCFVPWFDPAEHVLRDLIRNKSALDVTKTVHTYPRRYEFVKPCRFSDPQRGECVGGWLNDMRDEEHICPACHGTGKAPNFTTEQEVLQLVMPDNPEGLVELSKLSFTEPTDISLPGFLSQQVDEDEARIMAAVFDSGLYQKPADTKTRTATEIDAVMQGISDVLSPFASHISLHYELAYRVGAQYMEIADFQVDHSFPDDFDIASLAELVAGFDQVRASGVGFEAIAAQRSRIFQKVFEGNPERQKQIAARYKWLPFDDKSSEEVAMILAARSPLDDMRVLRENWLEIFREIEQETPLFPDMTYQRQKEVVMAKVQEFKTRIMLIDAPADLQVIDTIPMP